MTNTHLGLPAGKYYSPKIVVHEFNQLLKSVGQEAVFSKREYQADRELWIAALFALGVSANKRQQYWVGYGKDNTPDAEVVHIQESDTLPGKGQDLHITCLEIMEYGDHPLQFNTELVKKINKKYPPYFHLLIFVTKVETYDHDQLAKMVAAYSPSLAGVWLLGGNMQKLHLWELYPKTQWMHYHPVAVAKSLSSSDILSTKRGTGYEDIQKHNVPRKVWNSD